MKVIIVTKNNPELIRNVVAKAGHAVLAQTEDLALLLPLLLQYGPHVCFFETSIEPEIVLQKAISLFPHTRFVPLNYERGQSWTHTIRSALAEGPVQLPWALGEPERQILAIDLRYFSLFTVGKLKRPVLDGTWEIETSAQRLRLVWMMRTARQVRDRAESYRDAVATLDGAEWQEVVYRTLHGSYKSLVWARDQVARYLAYLCYYIPGADADCLMAPVPEPAGARFMHFDPPLELGYAVYCMSWFGFNTNLIRPFSDLLSWRFEGESDEELTRTALFAIGMAAMLKNFVIAQSVVMGVLLDPDTPKRLGVKMPKPVLRTLQTFRDFWGFANVLDLDDLQTLKPLLTDFHSSPQKILPENLRIPTFAQFYETTQKPSRTN